MNKKQDNPGYSQAIQELEEIVAEIENGNVDIDRLSEKIKRASVLIRICKEKLYQSSSDIKNALETLNGEISSADET